MLPVCSVSHPPGLASRGCRGIFTILLQMKTLPPIRPLVTPRFPLGHPEFSTGSPNILLGSPKRLVLFCSAEGCKVMPCSDLDNSKYQIALLLICCRLKNSVPIRCCSAWFLSWLNADC